MAWILDVSFFLLLIIGAIIGAKIGFVKSVCKSAGWAFSFIIPFIFCVPFGSALEDWFGWQSSIAAGINDTILAEWLTVIIAFALLFVIVKMGTWLIGAVGTALTNKIKAFALLNNILGSLLGMAEALLLIIFALLICNWIPAENVHEFINESMVVGAIYRSDLITMLPGYLPHI